MKYIIYFLLFLVCNGEKSIKVDIYPGFGWDHLRFLDMSPLYDVSNFNNSDAFQSCIEMIPLHENRIETGSVLIDAFDSHTTGHSSNLLIGGSGGFTSIKIGGSYSNEYQKLKHEQGEEKTITLRNHIDYIMVDVILQSSCPLNSQVKKDLIQIAKYITTDQPLMATYAAQLFVKTYGTHFTSRLYLGGSISEDDFVSHSSYHSNNAEKRLHKAAAEASFLSTFSLTSSFSSLHNDTEVNRYKNEINRKVISSKGGDVFISGKHMETWQASVKSRPAIIRRAVENMTYIIQSDKLPELTGQALGQVRQKINDAIQTYVEMNVIRGCMNRNSPSFNWIANVDDGSCAPARETSQFGGFIQTCTIENDVKSVCDNHRIDNFYTSTDQCKPGFDKYLLHKSLHVEQMYRQECESCGFLWLSNCCEDIPTEIGTREVNLYSCNKNITHNPELLGNDDTHLMHVFGGSFTSKKVNPITDGFTCPTGFTETNGPEDIKVCLTEKLDEPMRTLPRYGGMYSCEFGNIALKTDAKACPTGYSVYVMGAINGDCLLNVCLKFEKFDDVRNFPAVVLPPFFEVETGNRTSETHESTGEKRNLARMAKHGKFHKQIPLPPSTATGHQIGFGVWIAVLVMNIFAPFTIPN